jgi:hypothetical protein
VKLPSLNTVEEIVILLGLIAVLGACVGSATLLWLSIR